MFIVIVQFNARTEHRHELIDALVAYGREVQQHEPDTLRFEIVQDLYNPNRLFLYEVYANREGFTVHTQRPSFGSRWESFKPWLDGPTTHLCSGTNVFPPEGDAGWGPGRGSHA